MFDFLRVDQRSNKAESAIDFMKFNKLTALLSVFIFVTFLGTYFYKYHSQGQTFNYSVDFTGGIQAYLKFNKAVKGERLVEILEKKGWPGAITREFSENEHLVRVKKDSNDVQAEAENMSSTLQSGLGDGYIVTVEQIDSVGSAAGSELWTKSFYAIIFSLIGMLLYIGLRFLSFSYAMGAIVSLFHDVTVILAIFLILDKEISMNVIGAILAVLGYSINDTIVIFSRVRDNAKKLSGLSMSEVINVSITETLSRTVLTTISTLLVVVSLFLFGGETLRDMSFALLIGMIFGIYSTIFIANPVLLMLYKDRAAVK